VKEQEKEIIEEEQGGHGHGAVGPHYK